jgi:hypothetical protein
MLRLAKEQRGHCPHERFGARTRAEPTIAKATTNYSDPGVQAPERVIASHPQPLGGEPLGADCHPATR